MKSVLKKSLSLLIVSLLICTTGALPAFANSAWQGWEGSSQTGTVPSEKENPIAVEKEVLTFNIPDYPAIGLEPDEEYRSNVTAEYTFVNTSDETVTAKLLFPFGRLPAYIKSGQEGPETRYSDTDSYDITVNGEAIPRTLRYTFLEPEKSFELNRDLARVKDDIAAHEFYSPQMPVTCYTFQVSGVDFENNDPVAAFDIPANNPDTRLYPAVAGGVAGIEGTDLVRASAYLYDNGQEFSVYAFGKPLPEIPEWKIYANGQLEDGTEIDGRVELVDTIETTFSELTAQSRPENLDISEEDWYRAVVAVLDYMYEQNERAAVMGSNEVRNSPLAENLMRWYEYELTLEPGETITNTVTAPLYPTVDYETEPGTYRYQYLLSPAKTWKNFGPLDIRVNTKSYMIKTNLDGWQKTEEGYTLSRDGLPDDELSFTLCEEENPAHVHTPEHVTTENESIPVVIAAVVIAVLVILAVILFARKKRRKS